MQRCWALIGIVVCLAGWHLVGVESRKSQARIYPTITLGSRCASCGNTCTASILTVCA